MFAASVLGACCYFVFSPPSNGGASETAIVILGGDMRRLHRGMELQRQTQLPVLISGAFSEDYVRIARSAGAGTVMYESASMNTEENAAFASCLLRRLGTRTVFLVSDEWHLPRAGRWFGHYGVRVTAIAATRTAELRPWPLLLRWGHEVMGFVPLLWAELTQRRLACPAPVK